MSHFYRLVRNRATGAMVAVSETATGQGKGGRRSRAGGKLLAQTLLGAALLATGAVAAELPTGGQVTAGQASISTNGAVMNIDQSGEGAAINWNSTE